MNVRDAHSNLTKLLPARRVGAWYLKEFPDSDGPSVFSCFHCGGGSTMGYKLAGCRVLGGVEIDPRMSALYVANNSPNHEYVEGVQDFTKRDNSTLPKELFELDVLDGSPPCSSFSLAGSREKAWGTKKKFREGQAVQVLDDLFGEFLKVAGKLRPKVVIAENVKGMLAGNAKGYIREVLAGFKALGYEPQLFLLDASRAGVPQVRERVVFVARRVDLKLAPLVLMLDEKRVALREAFAGLPEDTTEDTTERPRKWAGAAVGGIGKVFRTGGKFGFFKKASPLTPAPTLQSGATLWHWAHRRLLNRGEVIRVSSFPEDYDFGREHPHYVCGMSVPPFLMQRVALALREQWLG